MTIKDKLKSYNFWITLVSAIILLLQVFGEKFNFKIDSTFIIDVTTALCSIFVILGIITVPKSKTAKTDIRFVEPNYEELSTKISNELMDKISLLETKTKETFEETKEMKEQTSPVQETKMNETEKDENLKTTLSEFQTDSETIVVDDNSETLSWFKKARGQQSSCFFCS